MKKIITFIVLVSVLFSGVSGASAASLGSLSYWEANTTVTNSIGRWGTQYPTIWSGMSDSSISTANFASYVNHAMNQWNQAGINNGGANELSQASIVIRGGTYTTLRKLEPKLLSGDAGLTTFGNETVEGTWKYNNTDKTGFRLRSKVYVYVVQKSGKSSNGYKKTTTHELGHALGWIGHTSNTSDIMYHSSTEITTLSTRDKRHLKQVY